MSIQEMSNSRSQVVIGHVGCCGGKVLKTDEALLEDVTDTSGRLDRTFFLTVWAYHLVVSAHLDLIAYELT